MDTNHRNRGRKSDNKYSQSALDAGIYSKLDAILKELQNDSKNKDYNQLIQFCERGYLNQLVQNWSYYAQVNNHSMFAKKYNTAPESFKFDERKYINCGSW